MIKVTTVGKTGDVVGYINPSAIISIEPYFGPYAIDGCIMAVFAATVSSVLVRESINDISGIIPLKEFVMIRAPNTMDTSEEFNGHEVYVRRSKIATITEYNSDFPVGTKTISIADGSIVQLQGAQQVFVSYDSPETIIQRMEVHVS
jgi:hypothetical protein